MGFAYGQFSTVPLIPGFMQSSHVAVPCSAVNVKMFHTLWVKVYFNVLLKK